MFVNEIMQRNLKTIGSSASVADAVAALADSHVTALPVLDQHGRMIGVVSTSDLLAAEAEVGGDGAMMLEALFDHTTVREIMTPRPYTIPADADLRDAARQMLYADVHRLFVTEEGKLAGVISTTDIVRAVATNVI